LAPLPFLQAFHYLAADALTGAGRQRLRSAVQLLVIALNVGLCLRLIPEHSWRGAAWASLASDAALAAALWVTIFVVREE